MKMSMMNSKKFSQFLYSQCSNISMWKDPEPNSVLMGICITPEHICHKTSPGNKQTNEQTSKQFMFWEVLCCSFPFSEHTKQEAAIGMRRRLDLSRDRQPMSVFIPRYYGAGVRLQS